MPTVIFADGEPVELDVDLKDTSKIYGFNTTGLGEEEWYVIQINDNGTTNVLAEVPVMNAPRELEGDYSKTIMFLDDSVIRVSDSATDKQAVASGLVKIIELEAERRNSFLQEENDSTNLHTMWLSCNYEIEGVGQIFDTANLDARVAENYTRFSRMTDPELSDYLASSNLNNPKKVATTDKDITNRRRVIEQITYTDDTGYEIGRLEFASPDENTLRLDYVNVHIGLRKQGIGEKLVRRLVSEAKKRSAKTIRTHVEEQYSGVEQGDGLNFPNILPESSPHDQVEWLKKVGFEYENKASGQHNLVMNIVYS